MAFKSNRAASLRIAIPVLFLAAAMPVRAQTLRQVSKLADGVYSIEHRDNFDGFKSGNTTVIIGDRQVFVVDACFLPSAAREDIAEIRKWTDKPVSFLINTHFHNDHNLANRIYMDNFPALTIIAHIETKRGMDMFGPGSESREEKQNAYFQQLLETGKTKEGRALTAVEKKEVKDALAQRAPVMEELKKIEFQSATLTFDHDFSLDIGNREVQIKFLGRGNTAGDAIVYLPKEKIVMTGDLVSYPIPATNDGYPAEWIETLQNLGRLDAGTIVPGHGPVMHDKTYLFLVRDLLQSTVEQLNAQLKRTGPAMFHTLDEVQSAVDLSSFRERFAGSDQDKAADFDYMASKLVKIAFQEASSRW